MEHGEAIEMMAAERYLLDELTPEEKNAFEQHMFGCQECALDLRAGAAFINEAKAQLPEIAGPAPHSVNLVPVARKKTLWSVLWQPAVALPVFAAMLVLIAYQNLSTIPSLRGAGREPRISFSNTFHVGTRGSVHMPVQADRTAGLALAIELPPSSSFISYRFELDDAGGNRLWTRTIARPADDSSEDSTLSLVIPAAGLTQGSFTLVIAGVNQQNSGVEIDRRVLDVKFEH